MQKEKPFLHPQKVYESEELIIVKSYFMAQ